MARVGDISKVYSRERLRQYLKENNNIDELVTLLQSFSEENPIAEVMPPKPSPTEQLQKEDLKLVCWLALV